MKILAEVLDAIDAHARSGHPRECCGILLAPNGGRGGARPVVTMALPAENAEKERPEERYILGHRAHLRAIELETAGRARVAGTYHSHPTGGSRPSARDKALAVEGTTYLIVGLGGESPRHGAWRLRGSDLAPEPLMTVTEHD